MIGNAHFDNLVAASPVTGYPTKVDWNGILATLSDQGIDPSAVVATAWCGFQNRNLDFGNETPMLAIVHRGGILCTIGKRKMGGKLKFESINFSNVKVHAPIDVAPQAGDNYGKYGITLLGPGQVVLGSLVWRFKVKRFRDSGAEAMAAASDRDRLYAQIVPLLGGD
jgi:hypothetical protein